MQVVLGLREEKGAKAPGNSELEGKENWKQHKSKSFWVSERKIARETQATAELEGKEMRKAVTIYT